jgi:ribonuclease BN (tRNA processing enzyme)
VLGSCGAWPEPGRACNGFLLEHDGYRVVLDLGYGTLSRLFEALQPAGASGLNGVIVSHHHPDHAVDLHGLFRAWTYPRRSWDRLPVWAPPSVRDLVIALEDGDAHAVDAGLDFTQLPAGPTAVGPFSLESIPLPHFVPNVGVRLSSPGLVVAYTGDTGPHPAIADLGHDADLLIAEATDREQQPDTRPADVPGRQLTARDAGRAARSAGARRLMLTHFWPGNDRTRSKAEAQEEYPGEVLLAEEGLRVELA